MSYKLASCPCQHGNSKCHRGIFFSKEFGLICITRKQETDFRISVFLSQSSDGLAV